MQVISLRTQIDKIATNVTNLHAQSNSDDSLTGSGQLKGKILSLLKKKSLTLFEHDTIYHYSIYLKHYNLYIYDTSTRTNEF